MRPLRMHGFSLIETLIALALIACVSAALLPAMALAWRLQRDSAIETEAAVIAAARLESLKADVAGGATGVGGDLDAPRGGWHALVDRGGLPAAPAGASFDCRWRVAVAAGPPGAYLLSVRVVPLASTRAAVTLSVAVPDG